MENLIEYHVFEYTYNDDGVTMSVSSKTRDSGRTHARYTFDGVRERTVHLIRACVVIMQTCQQHLPETYDVSLRLYYNEGKNFYYHYKLVGCVVNLKEKSFDRVFLPKQPYMNFLISIRCIAITITLHKVPTLSRLSA